jgi:hypothetical protein
VPASLSLRAQGRQVGDQHGWDRSPTGGWHSGVDTDHCATGGLVPTNMRIGVPWPVSETVVSETGGASSAFAARLRAKHHGGLLGLLAGALGLAASESSAPADGPKDAPVVSIRLPPGGGAPPPPPPSPPPARLRGLPRQVLPRALLSLSQHLLRRGGMLPPACILAHRRTTRRVTVAPGLAANPTIGPTRRPAAVGTGTRACNSCRAATCAPTAAVKVWPAGTISLASSASACIPVRG